MHPLDIAITAFMALCGIGALLSRSGFAPSLIGLSMYLGWFATVGAVIVALVLLARMPNRGILDFMKRRWLGFANGLVAAAFLVGFVLNVR